MTTSNEPRSAAGIAWDLSALFTAPDDPAVESAFTSLPARADRFAATYRGTINVPGGPAPTHVLNALVEYEALQGDFAKLANYAYLAFAADTAPDAHRRLVGRVDEVESALKNATMFIDLEWLDLEDAAAQAVAADACLARYRHYLLSARRFKPHTLSEPEERVMNDKDLTGISAWQRFFTEYVAAATFPVEIEGETRRLNQSEALALMRGPDRDLRRRAWEAFFGGLAQSSHVLSFIYDTRFNDHLVANRLRSYPAPIAPRNLSNDVDGGAVEAMLATVERNYPLAHRYWRLKQRLLGLPKLELYDQYAPVSDEKESMAYDVARDVVLGALGRFSPAYAALARRFFDERWIDAELRAGKQGGAFCAGVTPDTHPYILLNYTDDMRDAMTLAHELGHGLHDCLAREQTLLNYFPSLPVAETASVFAEMLVFDSLRAELDDPRRRLGLICGKLEDSFATIFRQTVLTRFEERAYAARTAGRLSAAKIGELWLGANAPYYGDAFNLTAGYEHGWSYIPHFISTPFYCYAYAFGNLLVLALYGMYRREGPAFVPRYTALLAAGGSRSPRELLAGMGVDVNDASFWQIGFDELERLVAEAEALAEPADTGR